MALLDVQAIGSGYGDVPVLSDVSLSVGANEIVSVVGSYATPCATKVIATLARRAYRRPVTADDLSRLMALYESGRREGTFETGVQAAPLLTVFQTPPEAAPMYSVVGRLSTTAIAVIRPLILAGPRGRGASTSRNGCGRTPDAAWATAACKTTPLSGH